MMKIMCSKVRANSLHLINWDLLVKVINQMDGISHLTKAKWQLFLKQNQKKKI